MNLRGYRLCSVILCNIVLLGVVIALHSAVQGQEKGKVIRVAKSEFDEPLAWLQEAKQNYTTVKDYSCTMVSQENVRGKLHDQNVIQLKLKTDPFSIHMRWISPEKNAAQEVAFVLGKNNNKMRVKSNHLGNKILGFMSIDPNDPRVLEHSRHTILEAGIGNMIEQHIGQWEKDRQLGKSRIAVRDYVYNNRECHKVEVIRTEKNPAFYCYRTVIYLEKKSKLPIRLENYDWPRQGGPEGGEMLETFSYINLQFNTGLKDAEFNK